MFISSLLTGAGGGIFIILLTALTPFARRYLNNAVDQSFQQSLLSHKNKLASELAHDLERVRLNHQRLANDFERYSSMRHQVYGELYKYLWISLEDVKEYVRRKGKPPMPNMTGRMEAEVREILISQVESEATADRLVRTWKDSNSDGVKAIETSLQIVYRNKTVNRWVECRNYLLTNELFLSKDVSDEARQLVVEILEKCIDQQERDWDRWLDDNAKRLLFGNPDTMLAQGDKLLTSIRKSMRDELSVGYYGSNNES